MSKSADTRRKNLRDRRASQLKAMVDAGDVAAVRELGIDQAAIEADVQAIISDARMDSKQLGANATQADLLRALVHQQHAARFHANVAAAERKALEARIELLEGARR